MISIEAIPSELWIKIIEVLDCKNISNIKLTSHYFNDICKKNDFYMKRKYRGFPRAEGRARIFIDNKITDDLVRGDLCNIGQHPNPHFYDGNKLIKMKYLHPEGNIIPSKFKIINDNVPLDYWKLEYNFESSYINHQSIPCTNIFWFDQTTVLQQCLNNVKNENGITSTNFDYNDKNYIIEFRVFSSANGREAGTVDDMKMILTTYQPLLLQYYRKSIWFYKEDYLSDEETTYQKLI